MLIATITQDGLNTTSSTLNIPWQYSGGFTINFVKDSAYNSYTASCVMGVYDSSVLECAKAIVEPGMVVMSNNTITVPNSMMAENGYLIVAITLTSGSESIALKPVIYKISGNINAVSPLPDDDPTWQSIVESYVNTFLSDNVPTYDEIDSLYLPKQNPTLPWDSELYGLNEDGTKILMHRLMQLPSDEIVNLLGTSGTKTAIMVGDKSDRPVILYGGANELELAVKDDIPNTINNLNSSSATDNLSANQGKVLNTSINQLKSDITTKLNNKIDIYNLNNVGQKTGIKLFNKPIYTMAQVKTSGFSDNNQFTFNISNVDDLWIDLSNSFIKINTNVFPVVKTTIPVDGDFNAQYTANTCETYITRPTSNNNWVVIVSCGRNIVGGTINKILLTIKYTLTTD